MVIMAFLSDIRNAVIANAAIVIFHIYIAFAVEGVGFLLIVLPIGGLVAGAYAIKGKIGAGLLTLPTLGYLFVVPEMFKALSGGDQEIGWGIYLLVPFWLFTILLNIMSIVAEARGISKYANR